MNSESTELHVPRIRILALLWRWERSPKL